jgi:hypothetical protein
LAGRRVLQDDVPARVGDRGIGAERRQVRCYLLAGRILRPAVLLREEIAELTELTTPRDFTAPREGANEIRRSGSVEKSGRPGPKGSSNVA